MSQTREPKNEFSDFFDNDGYPEKEETEESRVEVIEIN